MRAFPSFGAVSVQFPTTVQRCCGAALAARWLNCNRLNSSLLPQTQPSVSTNRYSAGFIPRRFCSTTSSSTSDGTPASGAGSGELSGTSDTSPEVGSGKIQIAVVGSGPSGCYVAEFLTKKNSNVHVDVYERLPVPFGLCRYGVAPDHPDVKNVEKKFMEMFKSGRATFIGNVCVGKDIPLKVLLDNYSAVVFATGADVSKKLYIPGEELGGVLGANDFVGFYNTLPFPYGSPRFCPFDLSTARRAIVIGNGNVAMDCTRILAGPSKYFNSSDMNCVALKEMLNNRIENVTVVGRRGVEHSAFALAEFREMTMFQPDAVKVRVDPYDLPTALKAPVENARAHKRMMEYVHKFTNDSIASADIETIMKEDGTFARVVAPEKEKEASSPANGTASTAQPPSTSIAGGMRRARIPSTVDFRYNLKPVRILSSPTNKNLVGGVIFEQTAKTSEGGVAPSKRYVALPCDVVIKSVGYRSEGIKDVPFDHESAIIPNEKGRVTGCERVYCAGWIKRGPKGVILHSLADSQDTVATVLQDIANGVVHNKESQYTGKYGLIEYFVTKKLHPVSVVGVGRIHHVEEQRGIDLGKRLEKVDSVKDMLDIALGGSIGKKANNAVRGITNERPDALLYLNELLDEETDLAPLARELAKDIPRILGEEHPSGKVHPSQL